MRTLAIGDIHGCHNSLAALLRKVQPAAADQIIFLGDYIDRGPDSRGVIETLLKLQGRVRSVFLRGNHEEMMLDSRDGLLKADIWQDCGGLETLASYKTELGADWESAIPDSHWSFIEKTLRGYETPKEIFVHGCLSPDLDLGEQPDEVLLWETFGRIRPHKSGKRVICGHSS
jgi:serine/threonine protein phosphatase 1